MLRRSLNVALAAGHPNCNSARKQLAGNKQMQAAYLGIWFCDKSLTQTGMK
jgi:hypothetical protein